MDILVRHRAKVLPLILLDNYPLTTNPQPLTTPFRFLNGKPLTLIMLTKSVSAAAVIEALSSL